MTGDGARAAEKPLIPGVIHGVRVWHVDEHSLLRGIGYGGPLAWSPDGEPTSAHCLGGAHRAPDPECDCGLYAYHPDSLTHEHIRGPHTTLLTGVIEAWGRIELHEDGFRAQYARPVVVFEPAFHLAALDQLANLAAVSRRYGAPIVAMPKAEHAKEWCRQHGYGLSEQTVAELIGAEAVVDAWPREDRWEP